MNTATQTQTPQKAPWHLPKGWLYNGRFDSILLFGVLSIALSAGALVTNRPEMFVVIFMMDLWLLGYHHVIATFSKLAGTASDRRENRFLIYSAPVLVLGAVVALAQIVGVWSVISIYFFWQWFHYVRQSYGISVFYRTRVPGLPFENRWVLQTVLWSVPVWGVLNRCAQGWDKFLYQDFWAPAVPAFVVTIVGAIALLIVASWLVSRIVAWKRGQMPLGQTLFIASHLLVFYVAYVGVDDINQGWLIVNIWHNAQYVLFVWLYNTKRFANSMDQEEAPLLGWLSQPKPVRIIFYFGISLILTSIFYGSLSKAFEFVAKDNIALLGLLYVISFQTINFHHYLADAYIWKARKKQHRAVIGEEKII